MEILSKVVRDLIEQDEPKVRDALRRFHENPDLQQVTFTDSLGRERTIFRCKVKV